MMFLDAMPVIERAIQPPNTRFSPRIITGYIYKEKNTLSLTF